MMSFLCVCVFFQDKWIYTVAGITENMRSLANRVCKKPDEAALSPEICNLLQDLESSVQVMKGKEKMNEGEVEEVVDGQKEFENSVTKKQVRNKWQIFTARNHNYLGSIF